MNRDTWKQGEARIAKLFNTVRTPLSGGNSRHTRSDTLHSNLFIEVKHNKTLPFLSDFRKSIEETEKLAKEESKIPLSVFIKMYDSQPFVICRLKDILEIAKHMKIEKKQAD
jgi:hypothetical protein